MVYSPRGPIPPNFPRIHYMQDNFQVGAKGFSDNVQPMHCGSFEEVLYTRHMSDAHFVSYCVPGDDFLPRMTIPLLSKLQAMGTNVYASMLVFDWDTPNHVPLTEGLFNDFFAQLTGVASEFPLALNWTFLYPTRAGCRLLYVLKSPIVVQRAEAFHRGIVLGFKQRGIALDEGCSDWTRLFRLPFVVRDKTPTWEDPVSLKVEPIAFWENTLDPVAEGLPEIAKQANAYGEIKDITDPMPDWEACQKLLYITNDAGKSLQSDFLTQAKRRLRGRECFPVLFEHKPIAEKGSRNSQIHELVGQVVGLLYAVEGCRPQHIHALFMDSVIQLEPDQHGPPWLEVLWSAVRRLWAKEEAQQGLVQAKQEAEAGRMQDLAGSIATGMMTWCDHPMLHSEHTRVEYVSRHLIASVQNTYFLMRSDGYYDMTPLLQHQIVAAIRSRGMDSIIETKFINAQGAPADTPVNSIVGRHATVVSHIRAAPKPDGATISGANTPEATLHLPSYWRNTDLVPTFDKDVDMWLQKLAGLDYRQMCKWIGEALAFDEGAICALSITGRAGAGKKMLTEALGECLRFPRTAASEDMIGEYNYGLDQSPFLVIDEGWSRSKGGRHPADEFRHMVSGDPISVKKKYFAPATVLNPIRVIFTANNLEAIRLLSHKRDLSPDDQEALSIRLLHFDIGDDASNWLREMGGHRFTGAPGRRWIRGDGGEPSDFIVAKHFLWLHQHRMEFGARGGRFLVEGNASDRVLFELRTQAGVSPMVIEALIKMLEKRQTWEGLAIVDDRLYVAAAEVLEYYRNNLQDKAREGMTADQVLNTFKGLEVRNNKTVGSWVLRTRESMGPRKWTEIDCKVLLQVAQKDGWPCGVLAGMVTRQLGVVATIGPGSSLGVPGSVQMSIDKLLGKVVDKSA